MRQGQYQREGGAGVRKEVLWRTLIWEMKVSTEGQWPLAGSSTILTVRQRRCRFIAAKRQFKISLAQKSTVKDAGSAFIAG